jgi:hypothetical protein
MNIKSLFITMAAVLLVSPAFADIVLKQNTASQTVLVGPFVDVNGAPVTSLTISASDVRLSKAGGDMVAKNSGGCTHDELGMYACTFDATDTSTVGLLQVTISESGALLVQHNYQVVEEAVYDACCAASAAPLTNAGIADEVQTRTIAAVTTVNGLGNNVITAAALAPDAGTELATANWANGTRTLSAGTNIVLAKGTGIIGFNDISAAQVNAEVDTALSDYDGPTHAEMVARTLVAANYATAASISALNNISVSDIRSMIIDDQGNVNLGCGMAVVNAVLAGDYTTSGDTVTMRDATGSEIRVVSTLVSGTRTVTITCPTY